MNHQTISAAEALKLFRGQGIEVQTATQVMKKGEDGKERPAFETKMESLSEKHVLSAKKWDDGRVTLVTIDGQRYSPGRASAPAEKQAA